MIANVTLPIRETPGLKAKVGEIDGVTYFYLVDGLEREARFGEREDSETRYTKGVRAADAVETVIKEGLAYLFGLENDFEEDSGEELGVVPNRIDDPIDIENVLLKILETANRRIHSRNIDGAARNAAYHSMDDTYGRDGSGVIDAGVSCAYGVIVDNKIYGVSYGNVALVSLNKEQVEADTPPDEVIALKTPADKYVGSRASINDEGRLAVHIYQAELGDKGSLSVTNRLFENEEQLEQSILDIGVVSIIRDDSVPEYHARCR